MTRIPSLKPTPRERQLLNFIEHYQLKHGSSPTTREMRKHMKLKSDGFVIHAIQRLMAKNAIKNTGLARGIKPLASLREKLETSTVRLPVLGYVPAGGPVLTEEFVEDWISVDPTTIRNRKDVFFLRVKGESMMEAGIFDGDYVMVYPKGEARVGDVVVALIDNENTVKRFMKDKSGRPYLKAENPKFKDIHIGEGETLQIQGVVIGLLRWYS